MTSVFTENVHRPLVWADSSVYLEAALGAIKNAEPELA